MTNITVIPTKQALPHDLPRMLRELAEGIERGTITEMVVVYVEDDNYRFMWPSGLHNSLVLTTLAQHSAIERLKR